MNFENVILQTRPKYLSEFMIKSIQAEAVSSPRISRATALR